MPLETKPISVDKDTTPLQLATVVESMFYDLVDQVNRQTSLYYTRGKNPEGMKEGDLLITRSGGTVSLFVKSSDAKFDPLTLPQISAIEADITSLETTLNAIVAAAITATDTLNFPSTLTNTSSDLTIAVDGATTSSVVWLGVPNGSTLTNSCFTAWVSSANIVKVRFNNYSAGSLDPASGAFRVTVFNY